MYPFFNLGQSPKTFVTVDDTSSILAMKSEFLQFDSVDRDLAYSRHPFAGEHLWVIGGAAVGGSGVLPLLRGVVVSNTAFRTRRRT